MLRQPTRKREAPKFIDLLRKAHEQRKLAFRGSLAKLDDHARFQNFLAPLQAKEWVVYSKAPFGGPARVLKYLGRYTHRVAISNPRIVAMADGKVSFLWKDYRHGNKRRVMKLSAVEFLRRFLRHVLPKGFVRIRHYGLLANRHREKKLALCRGLLGVGRREPQGGQGERTANVDELEMPCPVCRQGSMIYLLRFEAGESPTLSLGVSVADTS